jgi:hypothetical protein
MLQDGLVAGWLSTIGPGEDCFATDATDACLVGVWNLGQNLSVEVAVWYDVGALTSLYDGLRVSVPLDFRLLIRRWGGFPGLGTSRLDLRS